MIKNVEKKFTKRLQKYNMINFFRFFSSTIEIKKIIVLFIIFLKLKIISFKQLKNFFIGIIITLILKNTIRRKRPFKNYKGIVNYDNKFFDEYSFPSGHSFTAFFIALAVSCKINNTFIKNIIIINAFIVSLSRVYLGVHYISDIMFSLFMAKYLVNY